MNYQLIEESTLPSRQTLPFRKIDNTAAYTFNLKHKKYEIKTATTEIEKFQAYKLRNEVFTSKHASNRELAVDIDRFDDHAIIMIIKNLENDQVIGTYRMISSEWSNDFYSASEFDLSHFLRHTGSKLELSRAAISPEYRVGRKFKRTTLHLF